MEKFILDANVFFNMEAGFSLGKKTDDVINNIIHYGEILKGKAIFLMPPSAVEEFLSFFEDKTQPHINKLLSIIITKSPNKNSHVFPAGVFYQLVDEVRTRNYRGLNLGEEEIIKAGQLFLGATDSNKKDFQMKIGPIVKNYRMRYRQATRVGFLDSVTDLDLIVLTKEEDGFLISADEGALHWGRTLGIKEILPPSFLSRLESLHHRG